MDTPIYSKIDKNLVEEVHRAKKETGVSIKRFLEDAIKLKLKKDRRSYEELKG